MATAKDDVRRMLDELPDDVTYEDIQYQLYVRQKIDQGTAEIERGEGIPHEEARRLFEKWLDE